jgi:hypothetical protein
VIATGAFALARDYNRLDWQVGGALDRGEYIQYFLSKLNTRAGSVLCAFVLICAGIYMCFSGLTATGSIDLKAALFEGQVKTGSLGILSMFLGVVIILTLNVTGTKPYDGQEIKLIVNGSEIVGKGLSFRKLRELVRLANTKAMPVESSVEAER